MCVWLEVCMYTWLIPYTRQDFRRGKTWNLFHESSETHTSVIQTFSESTPQGDDIEEEEDNDDEDEEWWVVSHYPDSQGFLCPSSYRNYMQLRHKTRHSEI